MLSVVDLAASGGPVAQRIPIVDVEVERSHRDHVTVALAYAIESDGAPCRDLNLDCAGGQAGHDVALERDRENHRRNDSDPRALMNESCW